MNDSKIAAKLRAQLKNFLGELLHHFPKPKVAFLGDMFYGLMAGGDVKLSKICRAYRPAITMKKAGDRLCMHLGADGIEKKLHEFIAKKVGRKVKPNTLIIVDPSDVQKPYARQMEFLSKVWDGSKGDVGDNLGYYGCMAVACESGGRKPMPMHLRFWSPDSPGFTSENDELESVFDILVSATDGRGIFIYDRGGDNIEFFRYFLRKHVDFVVRLKSRYVISWKRKLLCGDLADQCIMRYADTVTFNSHGKEVCVEITYGVVPVRLPEITDRLLHMVVVRGFGQKPMMLLTTLAKATTSESLWQVAEGYITRWRVEDTTRYVKQAYNLEDIRLLRYSHLKNMAAIVLAVAYFCMTWIGNSDKRSILAKAITDASLRIHELPDFHLLKPRKKHSALCLQGCRWFTQEKIGGCPGLRTETGKPDLLYATSALPRPRYKLPRKSFLITLGMLQNRVYISCPLGAKINEIFVIRSFAKLIPLGICIIYKALH